MPTIYQIASEQRNFLNQKGYNNIELNFQGMPDTTFTQLFNQLSEGIIKTWPENKSFDFRIDTAGKFDQLPGIAYFKFDYTYDSQKQNIFLTGINIQFHSRSIDIKLQSPKDLPHSSEIPDLVNKPKLIYKKYNFKSITRPSNYSHSLNM